MRNLLFVILSFALTILCWGMYGPVLHWGQAGMSTVEHQYARWRPFVCVGLAYFAIGVIVPTVWLWLRGEKGHWTVRGTLWSLAGGSLGALGALGIVLAFTFGGKPIWVMPLVFGGAPVVNAFLTIWMARKLNEIGPVFVAGLVMVVMGAVTVLVFAPNRTTTSVTQDGVLADLGFSALSLLSVAMTVGCWGSYGTVLHKGQAAMVQSRLRPLLCVGLAYFAIAVLVPNVVLAVSPEPSQYSFTGTLLSLAAGACGALGALGIIMAFNFGGKPVYVMPLIFGGAPVVATLFTATQKGLLGELHPMFLAGLMLVIAGSAMVLVFAPRGSKK